MDRLKSIVLAVFAAVMAASLILPAVQVSAEGSAALGWPPRKDYTVEPGKTVEDTIVLSNRDRELPLNLRLRVIDFTFSDDSGTPKLLLDENEPQTAWSLKPFLKLPELVTVDPGATKTIDISVTVPEEYKAGSYYSAIVYQSASSEGGNVGLSASGVTLVFANLPGEVHEQLALENLGTYNSDTKKYTYFNSSQPKRIAYTVRNEGNVVGNPTGSITLKNWFGHEVTINNMNPNGSLVLIGQEARVFDVCIKMAKEDVEFAGDRQQATTCANAGLWPGYYSVTMDGFYSFVGGNVTKELSGKAGFWYLPWWFVLAAIAVLAFVGYHVWKIVRFFKRRSASGNKFKKRDKRKK